MVSKRGFCHFNATLICPDVILMQDWGWPRARGRGEKSNVSYRIQFSLGFLAALRPTARRYTPGSVSAVSSRAASHRNAGMLRGWRVVTATEQLGYRASQSAWTRKRERKRERWAIKNLTASFPTQRLLESRGNDSGASEDHERLQ